MRVPSDFSRLRKDPTGFNRKDESEAKTVESLEQEDECKTRFRAVVHQTKYGKDVSQRITGVLNHRCNESGEFEWEGK